MPLKVGDAAPDFEAPDQHGNTIRSADYTGKRHLVYFYPRDQTHFCTQQACGFQEGAEAFKALGVPVIGVSSDSIGSHKRFAEKYGLEFTLLSDRERVIIEAFGVNGLLGRTSRTTFVVGPDGKIEAVHRAELSGRGHVEWAEAQLKALVTTA